MARREYKGAATPTTITSGITNSATSLTLTDATNWPTGSFSFVIDPGLAGEEKILATSRTGTVVAITTRGYDNTTASSHIAGAIIYPVPTAIDFDEANSLVSGITAGTGITMAGSTSGSTLFKSSAAAGSTTVTLPAATDTLVGKATTDILTNKTLTSPAVNTAIVKSPREITTVSATAATGTINFDANTQGTLYYTTSASANWTLNVRGDSGTTLNSVMATGDCLTITFLVAQGATAYYASALTIDGTSVTPKIQGGTAWTAGNASSTDAYTYAIVKTGSAAYTVFASQTKFAQGVSMPILGSLGGLSARGFGFGAGPTTTPFTLTGNYDALSTVTVPSGGLSSITFAGIPQTGYTHLQIRAFVKTDRSTYGRDETSLRFNSDSASNYSWHTLYGNGGSASSYAVATDTNIDAGYISGGAGTDMFGGQVIDILDYTNTNKYKTIRSLSGHEQNGTIASLYNIIGLSSGSWRSTSAINSITIGIISGTLFNQYSSFALYGVK